MSAGTVGLVAPLIERMPVEFTVDDLQPLLPDEVRSRQVAAALTRLVRSGTLVRIEDPNVDRGMARRRWRRVDVTEISQQTPPAAVLLRSDEASAPNTPEPGGVAAEPQTERLKGGPLLTHNSRPVPSRRR